MWEEKITLDRDCARLAKGYLYFWREEETFPTEQLNDLFSNVEKIYKFNKSFSEHLNECNLEAVAIAKCFVHHSSGFGIYTQYCTDYPGIMAALARLMREPDSAQPFRSRQAALGHALPLGSYLLKPVQRILKYHLLLQNLVKQHKSHDTEYALNKMTGIAHDINEMKRRHEHSVRVQEIQSLLYGWNGQDLTTFGELCAEGTFRVFGAKAMRHAFLFDKMLLLTKNKEYGILAYKSHIMCNNLMLVESIQGQPLSFHVIPFDCPRMQVTLQARSIQHKREWTLLLKRNILENYNAVIPSHARQLVMELGQNKTDDDIIAEKSSTLMSHSSMRKQLGAPEYLEKRKLERDRRKSFESGLRYKLKRTGTRKEQFCNNTIEDESEKEQNIKEDLCHSHYVCSECYNIDKSNVNICEDCDDQFICANCIVSDDSKDNTICQKCNSDKTVNSKNKHKCKIEKSQYLCCKCAKPGLPCEKLNDNILLRIDRSNEYLCENCTNLSKNNLNKHSSEKNIYDRLDNDCNKILDVKKTCLKCHEIKENIIDSNSQTIYDSDNQNLVLQKDMNCENNCVMCGKKKIICKNCNSTLLRDDKLSNYKNEQSLHCVNCNCRSVNRSRSVSPKTKKYEESKSPVLEIKMYNAKTVPKKISKIKKNRAKTMRHLTVDATAKFYTEINDLTSDEVLHISESTDSINNINGSYNEINILNTENKNSEIPIDMDEEMYKSLIQKTDSFKKSELEKDKLVSKVSEEVLDENVVARNDDVDDDVFESCDDTPGEKPLEQIISQLLMQNREFQKILKRHQMRSINNRRHQRLIKSHSNPEKVFAQKDNQFKLKFGRQLSESNNSVDTVDTNVDKKEEDINKDDKVDEPIYETLIKKCDNDDKELSVNVEQKNDNPEPDYVYLCFDNRQNINAYQLPVDLRSFNNYDDDGQYAIPNVKPKNVYDEVEIRCPEKINKDNEYENTSDIWKRISKDTVIENKAYKKVEVKNEYVNQQSDLDGLQSPNLPKIWLNRQKEHFNTPREKKSGSLPRSFQVHNDQNDLIYQNKPINNKVYLNKDGKVMQTDRPFTIASDHSEICYDDIERFIKINDDSSLKFPQKHQINDSSCSLIDSENIDDIFDSMTQSNLELEAEIERCYNNRFGSEQNHFKTAMNNNKAINSISSSLEVINDKLECETSQEDITHSVHPEHKIYKPTNSNLLSFKSVLNRFKSKNKSNSEPDKEETQKKVSPKNNRNILQRLKNMKSDEQNDTSEQHSSKDDKNSVLITDTDIKRPELMASKSFCEDPVTNLNEVELVSKSCNNITLTIDNNKSKLPSGYVVMNKSSKSTQELHKLPIYKQGSKLLGARIAQSDYADPKMLAESYSELNKVNMFVNKSSMRPDSVLSNSSNFTSSSDGYMTANTEISKNKDQTDNKQMYNLQQTKTDESFYERSFEEIEKMFNSNEIFRDSAIYSDPEDVETQDNNKPSVVLKKDSISKLKTINITRTTNTLSLSKDNETNTKITSITTQSTEKVINSKIFKLEPPKITDIHSNTTINLKAAPPVPAKPIINKSLQIKPQFVKTIPSRNIEIKKPIIIESLNANLEDQINQNIKMPLIKESLVLSLSEPNENSKTLNPSTPTSPTEKSKPGIPRPNFQRSISTTSNINLKRLSFERCSLDSSVINRRPKSSSKLDSLCSRTEELVITKSVQERRKEIEMMSESKSTETFVHQNRKSLDGSESCSSTTLNRSYSLKSGTKIQSFNNRNIQQKCNIPVRNSMELKIDNVNNNIEDSHNDENRNCNDKGGWVKQVVNRFQ